MKNAKKIAVLALIPLLMLTSCGGGESGDKPLATFESASFVYDGEVKTLEATNIASGYKVEYENNTRTDAGTSYAVCKVYKGSTLKTTLRALLEVDYPDYAPFEDYCKEIFLDYLGNDTYTWNVFADDPTNFGYERPKDFEAKFYIYSGEFQNKNYVAECYAETQEYYKMLTDYKDCKLSNRQMVAYRAIDDFFKEDLDKYNPANKYNPYMEMYYIDQFGGYASELNSMLENIKIRRENDVKDIVSIIESAPASFASYIVFGEEKAAAGYPLSDYTLDECIKFVQTSLDDSAGKDYYLVKILQDKIDGSTLTDAQKTTYKTSVANAIKNDLVPAYTKFVSDLATLKGKCNETQANYYQTYDGGSQFYLNSLKGILGMWDVTVDGFYSEIVSGITKWLKKYQEAASISANDYLSSNKYKDLGAGKPLSENLSDPYDMLAFLKEFAKTIAPELKTEPEIVVKHMSEAEQESSNATAYYLKSSIDYQGAEYITLNDKKLDKSYELFSTLSHEGYPGHLYEYVNSKSLGLSPICLVMSSMAHAEGWATYVEYNFYDYVIDTYTGEGAKGVKKFFKEEQTYGVFAYLVYTFIDLLVNGKQYDADKCKREISGIGLNSAIYEDIQPLLIEIPAEYAAYGYGRLFFLNIHDQAKTALGEFYNEVDFNKYILSEGWCSLGRMQELTDNYIERQMFLNGLN